MSFYSILIIFFVVTPGGLADYLQGRIRAISSSHVSRDSLSGDASRRSFSGSVDTSAALQSVLAIKHQIHELLTVPRQEENLESGRSGSQSSSTTIQKFLTASQNTDVQAPHELVSRKIAGSINRQKQIGELLIN